MLKTYILTFTGSDQHTIDQIEQIIQRDRRTFQSYWNYMPYVFCVMSETSARDLAMIFERVASKFFIAEINSSNINGRLPKAAWEWFGTPNYLSPFAPSSDNNPPPMSPFSSTKRSL